MISFLYYLELFILLYPPFPELLPLELINVSIISFPSGVFPNSFLNSSGGAGTARSPSMTYALSPHKNTGFQESNDC